MNESAIWTYLKGQGLTDAGVAGLMGNIYAESGLNPKNLQNTYEKKLGYTDQSYTDAVDNGTYTNFVKDSAGYGLCQWTYWSRKQNLYNYCQKAGKSIGDLNAQLGFLMQELNAGYKSLVTLLKTTTSVREASTAVLKQFERPANMGESVQTKRAGYGEQYYAMFASSNSTTTTPFTSAENDPELTEFIRLFNKMREMWKDNDSQDYSKEAREWAIKIGIIAGIGKDAKGDANYAWEDIPSREQMVTVLYRVLKTYNIV